MKYVLHFTILAIAGYLSCGTLALTLAEDVTIDADKDAGFFAAAFDMGVPTVTSNNIGAHTHVPVGQINGDRVNRSVFQFDIVGNVPSGATVTDASFNFEVTQQGGPLGMDSVDFGLHRVTTAWDEGTGSTPSGLPTGDGVTWDNATGATTWTTQGGDFDATSRGTVFVDGANDYSISSAQLVADIQAIVDGSTTDNGFLLKATPEGVAGTAARVTSREGGTPANLMITYTMGGVLLGDVNLDGVVDLLDIALFVDRISTATFQLEADVNEDGVVDLLDVQPFVDILSGA